LWLTINKKCAIVVNKGLLHQEIQV